MRATLSRRVASLHHQLLGSSLTDALYAQMKTRVQRLEALLEAGTANASNTALEPQGPQVAAAPRRPWWRRTEPTRPVERPATTNSA